MKASLTFLWLLSCTMIFMWMAEAQSEDTGAQVGTRASVQGDRVIEAIDKHEQGYGNLRSDVLMTLEDAHGSLRKRFLEVYTLESDPYGDKRKFVFSRPVDIQGTAVLIHSNVLQDDDQWIYLPAFRRVKRIATNNKGTPFVGSEFTYEDLASQEKEKYINRYLNFATLEQRVCDVVERIPKFRHSAYSKLIAYVDRETRRYRKVEYFDVAGEHVKTQLLKDYVLYDNRYWLPNTTVMLNHTTGNKTTMEWNSIQLGTKLHSSQFTLTALRRSR